MELEEEEPELTAFEMAMMKAKKGQGKKGRKRKKQWFDEMEDEDDFIERTLSLAD